MEKHQRFIYANNLNMTGKRLFQKHSFSLSLSKRKEKKQTQNPRLLNATFLFSLAHSFKIHNCIYFAGQTIKILFLAEKETKSIKVNT